MKNARTFNSKNVSSRVVQIQISCDTGQAREKAQRLGDSEEINPSQNGVLAKITTSFAGNKAHGDVAVQASGTHIQTKF